MLVRVLLRCGAPAIVRPATRSVVLPFRSYATPGRPKSVVGEPSRPVKRAVKKAAAKPADGSSPAEKKVAAKRTAAAKKSKKAAPKKKTLTEEQVARLNDRQVKAKARQQARSEKDKLAELKQAALNPPKVVHDNPYTYFMTEKFKQMGPFEDVATNQALTRAFTSRVAAVGAEWKSLNAADREHYNHLSRAAAEASQAEYKRWVESHSAEEIRLANLARRSLVKKIPAGKSKSKGKSWPLIKDERAVPRPAVPFIQFGKNRQASGDFRHIPIVERAPLIAQEWKALSEGEKQKYVQLYEQDKARWEAEYLETYGSHPTTVSRSASPAEATA